MHVEYIHDSQCLLDLFVCSRIGKHTQIPESFVLYYQQRVTWNLASLLATIKLFLNQNNKRSGSLENPILLLTCPLSLHKGVQPLIPNEGQKYH